MAKVISEDASIALERALVEFIDTEREKKKVSRQGWGQTAFGGEIACPQSKIQDLVGRRSAGRKPKRLSVGDYIKLCQALGVDPVQILAIVLFQSLQETQDKS